MALTDKERKIYVESQGYKLLEIIKEKGKLVRIKVGCPNQHIYTVNWKGFRRGNRCSECEKDNQRLDYLYVKNYIEVESNSGTKLISEEYINSDSKLILQCECGEYFEVSFNAFKRSGQHKCKACNNFTDWDINKVKDFCNLLSYKLLDDQYINSVTNMTLADNYGYLYFIRLSNLKSKKKPSRFSTYNPYTIQNIILWCKLNNKPFKLLNGQEYKGNNKYLQWQCLKDDCGEIFLKTWSDISQNEGCSFCTKYHVGNSNCLATKNPQLASEWHPTKNGDLTPSDVTYTNYQKIWWQCSCNSEHIWQATINSRNHGNGCPYCSGRYPTKDYNLSVYNPKLCEEWNYKRNKHNPEEYTPKSGSKVWWKCKECGYEWKVSIGSRDSGTNCPECNKSKGEIKIEEWSNSNNFIKIIQDDFYKLDDYNKINDNFYIPQKEFDNLLGMGGKNLSYDFYYPVCNLLVEYQGKQHEKYIPGFHKSKKDFEKQLEHDRRKREYAKNNNINLLEIWYWDFDNIEEILIRELMINNEQVI